MASSLADCIEKLGSAVEALVEAARLCGEDPSCYASIARGLPPHPFTRKGDPACYELLRRRVRASVGQGRLCNIVYSIRLDVLGRVYVARGAAPGLRVATYQCNDESLFSIVLGGRGASGNSTVVLGGVALPLATPRPSLELELKPDALRAMLLGVASGLYGVSRGTARLRRLLSRIVLYILSQYAGSVVSGENARGWHPHATLRSLWLRLPVPIPCRPFPTAALVECRDETALAALYKRLAHWALNTITALLEYEDVTVSRLMGGDVFVARLMVVGVGGGGQVRGFTVFQGDLDTFRRVTRRAGCRAKLYPLDAVKIHHRGSCTHPAASWYRS
ncbi:hypothetical protein Pyrfu_0546 [Pyrolobus fumarii 1A]|uniref:Uncharacterized protein n=1 Tax=Pyrolobus fumarii (strain DSM 11204 / 1A) TaxID=694429 RepID=G0EGW7_PYRF1|nr:hypothetical protein [Pyrolobus fumarii]AEM38417.1 hypothetical protein Pyrfu_0546 [Pyrolobus fumarii 1A]